MPILPEGWAVADNGLVGFFGQLVDEGHSQASAIRAFRDAGGTGSNAVLRGTYDFARDYGEARPDGWGHPVDQTLPLDAHVLWPTGGRDGFAYPVNVHVQNLSGDMDLRRTMVFSDVPLSPEEIYNAASDQLLSDDSEDNTGDTAATFGSTAAGAPLMLVGL